MSASEAADERRRIPSLSGLWNALASKRSYPLGYLAPLDGVRGLLTLGVMLAHTQMTLFEGAMIYMDVFFTMSGYLITSLLLKEYELSGRIDVRRFYLRRFMRLYPALTIMVVTVSICALLFAVRPWPILLEAGVTWVYLSNYARWLVPGYAPDYMGQTWSLAVEEQFYLLWPVMFIGLMRLFGVSLRAVWAMLALAAALWAYRCLRAYGGEDPLYMYMAFEMRADGLLVGCALAVVLKCVDLADHRRLWRAATLALPFLALAYLGAGFVLDIHARWFYYVSPLLGAIPTAVIIVGLLHPEQTFMHRLYQNPVLVYIGRICYGLYIWHFPIFIWSFSWAKNTEALFLIAWPLTFLVASLSYFLIERPFMRARPGV